MCPWARTGQGKGYMVPIVFHCMRTSSCMRQIPAPEHVLFLPVVKPTFFLFCAALADSKKESAESALFFMLLFCYLHKFTYIYIYIYTCTLSLSLALSLSLSPTRKIFLREAAVLFPVCRKKRKQTSSLSSHRSQHHLSGGECEGSSSVAT